MLAGASQAPGSALAASNRAEILWRLWAPRLQVELPTR